MVPTKAESQRYENQVIETSQPPTTIQIKIGYSWYDQASMLADIECYEYGCKDRQAIIDRYLDSIK